MQKLWWFCAIGWLTLSANAGPSANNAQLKSLMHTFVLEYAKMSPYLVSEESFRTEKGQETIKESLGILVAKTSKQPEALTKTAGFRVSYKLLASHLALTQKVLERGEFEYARLRVSGIGNLCASCHMQSPTISKFSAFEFITGKKEEVNLENANFLFTIRRYDEALAMFNQMIRQYPESKVNEYQLQEIYRHKLGILARVEPKPDTAVKSLSEDLENKKLPPKIRDAVKTWVASIKQWSEEKTNPTKMMTDQLIKYVASKLPANMERKISPNDPQLFSILHLSGLLYERLHKETNPKQAQALLYHLAQFERSVASTFWFPMSEIYLKECVIQFPKQEYSRKCFEAYQTGMRERYPTMPEDIRQSVEALRKYL